MKDSKYSRYLSHFAFWLVLVSVTTATLFIIPDYYKRMFGQFLSISSTMTVALVSYAHIGCIRRRVMCSVLYALKGDSRRLMVFLKNKRAMSLFFISVGTSCITLGLIAQIYSNQVGDKPIFFHVAMPLLNIVLFWVATNKLTPQHGHTCEY